MKSFFWLHAKNYFYWESASQVSIAAIHNQMISPTFLLGQKAESLNAILYQTTSVFFREQGKKVSKKR